MSQEGSEGQADVTIEPPATKSCYYHATLYQFSEEARKDVLSRFKHATSHLAASFWCSYDNDHDMFCLTSPLEISLEVDQLLHDVLSDYTQTELQAAEREMREPKVIRLKESDNDILDMQTDALIAPASSDQAEQLASQSRPIVMHTVLAQNISSIKPFKLRELPNGFLESILTDGEAATEKIISTGFTLRACCWSPSPQQWVFNGRTTVPLAANALTSGHIIDSSGFIAISNTQLDHATRSSLAGKATSSKLEEATKKSTMEQYLRGVGEANGTEPAERPETPADARSFLARSEYHISAVGRPRMAKGTTVSKTLSDNGYRMEQDTEERKATSFLDLLRPNTRKPDDIQKSIQLNDRAEEGQKKTFRSLFTKTEANVGLTTPAAANSILQTAAATATAHSTAASTTRASSAADQRTHTPTQDGTLTDYKGRFAAVDNFGLTSKAKEQAIWELENVTPPKRKLNTSGVRRRAAPKTSMLSPIPTSGSIPMSLSTGPDLYQYRLPATRTTSFNSQASESLTLRGSAQLSVPSWTNKIETKQTPEGSLVELSAEQANTPTKPPPGFGPLPNSGAAVTVTHQLSSFKHPTASTKVSAQEHGTLIDLSEESVTNTTSKQQPRTLTWRQQPLQPLTTYATNDGRFEWRSEDEIKERLAVNRDYSYTKKHTMGQQAKKNKGKKKKKGAASSHPGPDTPKPKVELPLPDPLPVPNTQKQKSDTTKAAGASTLVVTQNGTDPKTELEHAGDCEETKPEEPTEAGTTDSIVPSSAIGGLLQEVSSTSDITKAEIEIRFGSILLRHKTEKEFLLGGAFTPQLLNSKLKKADTSLQTDFFPRLSTSDLDARYLLTLIDGGKTYIDIQYEIHIRNVEGKPRTIKFNQEAVHDFTVTLPDVHHGTLYLHYPVRVWDAIANVKTVEPDKEMTESVKEFVSSIQTVDKAPSFVATFPSDAFAIESVLAKRVFSVTGPDNIELRITEAQNLRFDNVGASGFNFQATSERKEVLIEKQMLWWEGSLHHPVADAAPADKIQDLVDEVIGKMDCVGFENQGHWVREGIEVAPTPEIPFW